MCLLLEGVEQLLALRSRDSKVTREVRVEGRSVTFNELFDDLKSFCGKGVVRGD